MKKGSDRDWRLKLSLYLDDALSPDEKREIEEYLETHPDAKKELNDLRQIRSYLNSASRVETNRSFWPELSKRLSEKKREAANLLPFPRKYVPLAVALSTVVLTFIGYVAVTERGQMMQFLSETSQDVQRAYEENVLKGSVLPIFSKIDKDQVLQFALLGTLPLDANAQTSLRVDDKNENGYRLEVGRTETPSKTKITVEDLLAEVEPTEAQAAAIDSLLEDAKTRIASSAFVAENNALAIDPEIGQLTRVLVSNIAANLDPSRRERFDHYLRGRDAAYAIATSKVHTPTAAPPPHVSVQLPRIGREPQERQYLVITPDTMVLSKLFADMRELEVAHQRVRENREIQRELQLVIRQFEELQRQKPIHRSIQRFRVVGGSGFVTIQVDRDNVQMEHDSLAQWVIPRIRQAGSRRIDQRPPVGRGEEDRRREFFPSFPRDSMFERFWEDMERFDIDVERIDSMFREMRGRREREYRAVMDSMMMRWRENQQRGIRPDTLKQ